MAREQANPLNELLARYEQQPLLRGLVQLVPLGIGSAVESALLTKLQGYRGRRLREFFDELASGQHPLTEEIIEDDDFLYCYFSTVDAVLRSRRREKIRYLARLLRGAVEARVASADEYEELLSIVDDLSQRELALLALLAKREDEFRVLDGQNALQRASSFWPELVTEASQQLGILEDVLPAMFVRLQRSGCYEEFTGAYLGYTGGRGRVTELYRRLAAAAGNITDVAV